MEKRKWFYVNNTTEIMGISFYFQINAPDVSSDVDKPIDFGIVDFRKTKHGETGPIFLMFRATISRYHTYSIRKKIYYWKGLRFTLNLFGKVFTNDRW